MGDAVNGGLGAASLNNDKHLLIIKYDKILTYEKKVP
jgi:hypothetical protein